MMGRVQEIRMINDLRYAVTFPINGVSLAGQFSFQPGATAITGDNGAGKSFVAEMIRYGLFGKKALRGPASDYKSLDMALSFLGYTVKRAKKEELIDAEGEVIAVGADAINKKIVEILGFDLEVFDVVCAANQKESERLTRLTPAKRKELIDEVVGLTRQEAVEKACKDEAKIARVEAEALTRQLVLPVEPVKPKGYRSSADIKLEYEETVSTLAQRVKLQRIIDAVGVAPDEPTVELPNIAEIEAHEKERITRDAKRGQLERQLAKLPEPTFTAEQLDEAEALAAYDADIARRGPRPDYDQAYLDKQLELLVVQELLSHDTVECPKCSHEFDPSDPEMDRAALAALPKPVLTRREIIEQGDRISRWENPPVEPKGTRLAPEQISTGRMALALASDKPRLEAELAALTVMDDRSAELVEARRIDREWDFYTAESTKYLERHAQAKDAEKELKKLPTPKHTPEDLNADYTAAVVYERELDRYGRDRERFDDLTAEIGEKQARSEAFTAGAKGLVEARRTLKAFLAPSLSRVATKIIREMTANALRPLSDIQVDEDMNITADGQDVATFNGAHATMINLALRLALGQVLVARVMPLFIGDEIDSDATPANAQAIADGLMACKDQLKQIVLISHKRLENVDHEVLL
jgi:DNA repair exonuclease SbcCD ATPase subunit